MSNAVHESLSNCRPPAGVGRGDKYLAHHAQELRRILARTSHRHPELKVLGDRLAAVLAVWLVEMAEDLHNDIGIWRAVEQANLERYQTPLPFLVTPGEAPPSGFDARRFQYYLYVTLHQALCLPIQPRSAVLQVVAEAVSQYCREKFALVPRDSGVKQYLSAKPGGYLVVTDMLLWFGTQSYLLRPMFNLMAAATRDRGASLPAVFCRGIHTAWLGLTPVEWLARVLPLSEADRQDLLTWRKITPCGGEVVAVQRLSQGGLEVRLRSLLNGREYSGCAYGIGDNLVPGRMARGNLMRWRGQWHWDTFLAEAYPRAYNAAQLTEIRRNDAVAASERILQLYPELAEPVRARRAEFHQQFVARHGGELTVVRTGREAAELWREQQRALLPEGDPPTLDDAMSALPRPLIEAQNGVAVHSDPAHGLSFKDHFDDLMAALKKPAGPWTQAELSALANVITDFKAGPALSRRLAAEHGKRIFLTPHGLEQEPEDLAFDWLLDANHGHYREPDYQPFMCLIPPPPA